MVNFVIFLVVLAITAGISVMVYQVNQGTGSLLGVLSFFFALAVAVAIRIANQWERAVILRLGRYSRTKGPGLYFIIPIIDQAITIDTRILTLDIPKQQAITKDNVPVAVNGVAYFNVEKADDAVIRVQSYAYAMSQYAQATLRDVIGEMTLDQLLAERERIGKEIERAVEVESRKWGLKVSSIKIMDIEMPEDLKKMMSRQASAEREKRATITKAEGDKMAAFNLAEAAKTMFESPGAMQLRTLQTIDGLGPSASNTVLLAVPVDIMEAVKKFVNKPAQGA